ncbi:ras and EF-hand domain-containing protein homolog isoform X2 [Mizuhopecten yessoensis]|uniref:ras and EF-hand domain-containing protein homolog isoform X2 n=1 Tax=Mizuhopecten yessoensis TaxID=6573 RepID=UPI000B45AA6E|nr:ras and EF-hand domain-containing protein homolog isoform X2 [Mizuhopecten yessoensis]
MDEHAYEDPVSPGGEAVTPPIHRRLPLLCKTLSGQSEDEIFTKESLSERLNLSATELDIVFSAVDSDEDGKIRKKDLTLDLSRFAPGQSTSRSPRSSPRMRQRIRLDSMTDVANSFDGLSEQSQEQVCELYQHLHASENPELLENFEAIILGVIKDVRGYKTENERLEKSFRREKDQHEKHLRNLEEEMEKEMKKMEETVRQKEQEKVMAEKAELKKEVEEELITLQQNLSIMQEEGNGQKNKELETHLLDMKKRLEDMVIANRHLKSELTDSRTNMALVRSELVSVRNNYTDKCRELHREKETVMDIVKEQDNLTRQLHLLQYVSQSNANQQLHDTNDDLLEAVIHQSVPKYSPTPIIQNHSRSSSNASLIERERRGSLMSDYIQSGPPSMKSLNLSRGTSIAEDELLEDVISISGSLPSPRIIRARLPRDETCEEDDACDDLDSGHSTLRDQNDIDSESEIIQDQNIRHSNTRKNRLNRRAYVDVDDEDPDSHDEDSESEGRFERDPRVYKYRDANRLPVAPNKRGSARSRSRDNQAGRDSGGSGGRRSLRKQQTTKKESMRSVSREPERMYKIVLAGDAATGKSSFIMRLCKGKFVSNLSSTLGVDFQTKVMEVDGRTIALQLWDTAGQERFRSIAKSYFRRADGVFLLYDCTYERSFLSIREWQESIGDSAQKNIPVMLCANKTDLRESSEKQGRKVVHYEDGQRLARECDSLFIETSAKDGSNVTEAVIELTRLMRANEDLEVKTVGLQLAESKNESKSSCCG